jgi:hypothetical protein
MQTDQRVVQRFLGAIVFLLAFFAFTRTPVDADLWWHLRAGHDMWNEKSILLADQFSYTRAGIHWVNAFWLSEILLFLLYKIGGYFALAGFVALTGAVAFYLIYQRSRANHFITAFVVLLAVIAAAPIWGPRPQIISFLLIAGLDGWLSKNRLRPPHAWVLVPLFIVWANLHGGWIWGFLLLAAHIAGMVLEFFSAASAEQKVEVWNNIKTLLGWSILGALAVGINPNGLAIWKLPFEQVNVSMQIQEWLSPDFHRFDFHPMLWMIFLLLLSASHAPKSVNWSQLFKVIGFAYLTFVAQRNIAVFAIVTAPLLAEWLGNAAAILWGTGRNFQISRLPRGPAGAINASILILLTSLAVINLAVLSSPGKVEKNYPVAAIRWIRNTQPEGRLFNSYNWGGYITWTLPQYPVFIDGRADMYGTDIINQWQDVVRARSNAMQILQKWNIKVILLEPDWPIVRLLESEGWEIVFQDEGSMILIKK